MHTVAPVRSPRRPGFTLTELLVVIAIIVVLVSLSAAGYFYFIGNQQRRNTESTFQTVQKTLQRHWTFVVNEAKKEEIPPPVKQFANPNFPSPDPTDPSGARARVVWVKIRLMEAFPASYAEVVDPTNPVFQFLASAIPANRRKYVPTYQKAIRAARGNNTGALISDTESSALLLLSLSINRGGSALTPDELGSAAVGDTDGDGLKEILDGWQRPLYFYRFAWTPPGSQPDIQQFNPVPISPKGLANSPPGYFRADPQDPDGHLLTWVGPNRKQYEDLFHKIEYQPGNPPIANYTNPIMVSAGRDGKLGLYMPAPYPPLLPTQTVVANGMVANGAQGLSDSLDNVYSLLLRFN